MKNRLLIFGGTSEGRTICEALSRVGREAVVCTATEYGGELVRALPYLDVRSKRLNADEMARFIKSEGIGQVVDATHPYAKDVTANIRAACAESGAEYIRVVRGDCETAAAAGEVCQSIRRVADIAAAVDYLATTSGKILLTTGSKELAPFCRLQDFAERVYARVLPDVEVIRHCNSLGFGGPHLIAMQGPFTPEFNLALLRQLDCKYLITKDTGPAGGLEAKLEAARAAGVEVVMIERPCQEQGCTLQETLLLLGLGGQNVGFQGQ